MTILDTRAWLWHVSDPKRLSAGAIRALAEAPSLAIIAIDLSPRIAVRSTLVTKDRNIRRFASRSSVLKAIW